MIKHFLVAGSVIIAAWSPLACTDGEFADFLSSLPADFFREAPDAPAIGVQEPPGDPAPLAAVILDIEPRLRTVAGYRHLPGLRAALQSSPNRSGKAVA